MRKNTARHWLHAGLDLLPLILIPVFMIYSHRHTIDNGSIEVPVNRVVDFNQIIYNGNFENGTQTWESYNSTLSVNDNKAILLTINNNINSIELYKQRIPYVVGHKYLVSFEFDSDILLTSISFGGIGNEVNEIHNLYTGKYQSINTAINGNNFFDCYFYATFNQNDTVRITNCMAFDLTQMFGEDNEPTLQQFNEWYSADYYNYTLSSKQLLKGYSTQTYDDTDIMSQFTYQLYNSVDKYFNMGNVFGMSNVYDWFLLNIFGGNASISIYIVWNIVLYEFVMDLLFLLYALFMWFIDVTKRLIEKPLDSIK